MEVKKIQKRLFGTNGVRGIIGRDLTPELVLSIGEAFGTIVALCQDRAELVTGQAQRPRRL